MGKVGSTFPVEMSLDVIKDKDDTLFVAFMRDISDEVKAEEELIQSWIRAFVGASGKEQSLTKISHEIRTPMNGPMWMAIFEGGKGFLQKLPFLRSLPIARPMKSKNSKKLEFSLFSPSQSKSHNCLPN